MLDLFVIEDDENDRNALIRHFGGSKEFNVTGYTDNSEEALRQIKTLKPHAVILDLELKRGGGDGLDFLKKLRAENYGHIYVVVTTNNISRVTHRAARALGCDYIMTKCEGDYSPKKVAELLSNVRPFLLNETYGAAPQDKVTPAPAASDTNTVRRRVHYELNILGVNHKSVGYDYLTEAIIMAYNGCGGLFAQRVGKLLRKGEQSVVRAMQNAINRAWNGGDPEELARMYTAHVHSDKGVPTVNGFIYYYAQKIKDYD